MRQIVLDTETTGLSPEDGHRIIEIGCVELLNRKITGNRFHVYINPEREIDQGAVDVHGLDNRFLADKPRFADIAEDFLAYVEGVELIIHNAPFDVGFLDAELRFLDSRRQIADYCAVLDTLALAKKKHPGQRNSLDALCKRYNVDNSRRELHGALLDAEILAEVYLAMTGGQSVLLLESEKNDADNLPQERTSAPKPRRDRPRLQVFLCDEADIRAHEKKLAAIDKASGGRCLWRQ
ncbi:MAG TPA: DNA polymerase III subunit epsilon [Methylococcaceae bacterium]|jgi:DNA polymerase-3 subunit epsilon|nr:DNA polymerase III subunit epsilon [Methylococcaceae bacterium]